MTVKPWSQPCPICGRLPCGWHEKGGLCDGEPLDDVIPFSTVYVDDHPEGLPAEPWLWRLWNWIRHFPTPWS